MFSVSNQKIKVTREILFRNFLLCFVILWQKIIYRKWKTKSSSMTYHSPKSNNLCELDHFLAYLRKEHVFVNLFVYRPKSLLSYAHWCTKKRSKTLIIKKDKNFSVTSTTQRNVNVWSIWTPARMIDAKKLYRIINRKERLM